MTVHTFLGVLTILMALTALTVFAIRVRPILQSMSDARPVNRLDRVGERINSIIVQVFGHKRLLKIRISGILHFFIFSGFVILFLEILETIIKLMIPTFSVGVFLQVIINIWLFVLIAGIIMGIYYRLSVKPERFKGSNAGDAMKIFVLIASIVIGIIIHTSFFRILAEPVFGITDYTSGHFLGFLLSKVWVAIGFDTPLIASIGYSIGFIMDIGVVLYFLTYLPTSKHFHVFTAVPSVYVRDLDRPVGLPEGVPAPLDKPLETNAKEGGMAINSYEDLTWKDTLDLYSCTECGRCQDVCPAYNSGSVLNPKLIITDLRDGLKERIATPGLAADTPLAGTVISEEALWGCTTCRACEEACPVFIEHVPKIVGLRAALVETGEVEARAKEAFKHWYDQGNAYGVEPAARPAVAKKADFSFKDARKESVDLLWFLGDVAAFDSDPGVLRSIQSISALFKEAGLDVGMLYDAEKNSGNDALRMGEHGLFNQLAQENLVAMQEANFDSVVTSDPHSFNTLLNDYPKLGFEKPVHHYTQLFLQLFKEGKLEVKNQINARVTYHDPCYLGRWNGILAQPRELIEMIGAELVEMPRHGMNSLCCGAGGGRFFMNESAAGERPSEQRIREAVELEGVTHFVVTCPKDVVMYSAAVDALGYQDQIQVVDIAELIAEAVGITDVAKAS